MVKTTDLYTTLFDAIPEHIAILDSNGTILATNTAWNNFAINNGATGKEVGVGVNYLTVCDNANDNFNDHANNYANDYANNHANNYASPETGKTSVDALLVADGLRAVINKKIPAFDLVYPCHNRIEQMWFKIKCWPMQCDGRSYVLTVHEDVTKETLLNIKLRSESLTDSLTGIANRRHFQQFLGLEWRRNLREESPLSIIMLDIDFFKLFNDRYGHTAGDTCLREIATAVQSFAKRPGDLAVRLGGEEFILILGNTPLEAATRIANNLRESVENLKIPHADSQTSQHVTASLGVVSVIPKQVLSENVLLSLADQALYRAKHRGRNSVEVSNVTLAG